MFTGALASWVHTGISRRRQRAGMAASEEQGKVMVDVKIFQTSMKDGTFRA